MAAFPKLLVGVDINNPDIEMFKFLIDMCRNYDATMVLAAFIPPIDINIMSDSYFPEAELDFIDQLVKDEEAKIKKYFDEIIENYADDLSVETHISVNDPVTGLVDMAEHLKATAIAVSYDVDKQSFLLRSSSVGNRLVNSCTKPVIVIPKSYSKRFSEDDTLLLTDDLTSAGLSVVEAGVNFTGIFGTESVVHCHIINDHHQINFLIEKMREFLGLERNESELITEQQRIASRVKKDLEMRWFSICEREDINYKNIVRMGDILKVLEDLVLDNDPGLILFGKHKAFHFDDASFGMMSFSNMMSFNRPVCVVP